MLINPQVSWNRAASQCYLAGADLYIWYIGVYMSINPKLTKDPSTPFRSPK